ncbi:MAG TPA: acyl-CoA dehydrogenase family protein [Pyrinomonadaceae bacterium]|jgi:alkylation response protein AidB-like acyl-CoA dehydrogenase|nr:acyl-CoA dehydrogenase family protein [Pyrinomonadaceae bacterium]
MSAKTDAIRTGGGDFLSATTTSEEVFTREDLSGAQQMFGRIAQDFMRTEVLPVEERIYNRDWALTRELLVKAGELDLLRVDIPEDYGGLGLDKVSSAYVSEQIGVMPSFAGSLGAHTTIGTLPLVYFGTEEQKAKYLPLLASGEWVAAYALTEPGSGSDALAARARATLDSDGTHYILNGQKMWITNGGFADVFTIFAKVDGERFTAFIVERAMGVVSGREEPKLGLDGSSTTALILENVRVPVENVLGQVGQGHRVAFNILNLGRLKLGTRNIGSARQALTRAARYAVERQQFGRAISEFGMIRQKLGEMAVRCFVGDAMVYRTLGDVDRALEAIAPDDRARVLKTIEGFAVECSINKVWTSEAQGFVVDEALQVYGGYGYSREFPAERAYRDARITRIYEGTNEINRLIIPTRLLKNPQTARLFTIENAMRALEDSNDSTTPTGETPFSAERALLARAKRLVVFTLGRAKAAYGDRLTDEQEVLAHIADIIIEVYAVESAILRAEKLRSAGGEQYSATPSDIARTYSSDAADRMEHSARQVLAAVAKPEEVGTLLDSVRRLTRHEPYDTVAARRRISDAILRAGRYYL